MFHGEFEFDDFWRESKRWQKPAAQVFTMLLLVGLILFGSLIMLNLIIAVLITDITQLQREADDQALVNQARQVLFVDSMQSGLLKIIRICFPRLGRSRIGE